MAQDGPKMAPRWPQDGPKMVYNDGRWAKIAEDGQTSGGKNIHHESTMWPQEGQTRAQEAAKCPQDGPKMRPGGPKMAQDGPKTGPRWPQDGPQVAPRWPQDGPRWPKLAPRCSQAVPRWPKMAPGGPRSSPEAPKSTQKSSGWLLGELSGGLLGSAATAVAHPLSLALWVRGGGSCAAALVGENSSSCSSLVSPAA